MILFVDIDGTLANSDEWARKCFIEEKDNIEEFNKHLLEFSINKWCKEMINLYKNKDHKIIILTARENNQNIINDTIEWLKINDIKYDRIIFKNKNEDSAKYKLRIISSYNCYNKKDILILEDNPRIVQLLRYNNYIVLQPNNLY